MINRVVLVGRLTKDPELRKTNNDTSVASLTLAVDGWGKGKDGNKVTYFLPIVVWGEQANNVCKFTKKGSLIGVDGRLSQRSYERKDGTKQSVVEVVAESIRFLESKGNRTNTTASSNDTEMPSNEEDKSEEKEAVNPVEDDLPF